MPPRDQVTAAAAGSAGSKAKFESCCEHVETHGFTRLRHTPPPFTVGDIRRAIPKHCFERSLVTSFRYLFQDLALAAAVFWLGSKIDGVITDDVFGSTYGPLARHVAWCTYWVVQGFVLTGLWVIGHECGHGGFADSSLVNDVVGSIIHSFLLVPYFSWKISHRKHHSNTGNMAKDEVFVPSTRADVDIDSPFMWSLPMRVWHVIVTFTVGWPAYLAANVSGHEYPKGRAVNHFSPWSPIFVKRERILVVLSDVFLLAVCYVLYLAAQTYSWTAVLYYFFVPYLFTNFWLVFITLLQHTDVYMPHYEDNEWDWLRGALCTVDRDYGFLNVVMHHIMDTHVAHHLFSSMPHYHAQEATEAIKPILGDYYRFDDTPIFQAMWRAFSHCHYVDVDKKNCGHDGVLWFHDANEQRAAKRSKKSQ